MNYFLDEITPEDLAEFEPEPIVWDTELESCPECGADTLWSMPRANGPDDFVRVTECRNCGATWEN
jgi:hypothetical protein